MHLLTLLPMGLVGRAYAQSQTTEGPNLASWSRQMSMFPAETYCPETASNPYESEYEACRSTAWDNMYRCPGKMEDSDIRTSCICSSIIHMSSCLSAYCPSNSVQASLISQDQADFTSIYGCPTHLGAAAGGGGPTPTGGNGAGASDGAKPSNNGAVGGKRAGIGGGSGWTAWFGLVAGGVVGAVAVLL
ncbi:hypothetical protein V8F20_009722 [Naviculisporaceae sp. PSN 640]